MEPYAFLVPLLLIILVFLIVPIVKAAIMSFQYYYIAKPSSAGNYFVGLKNYQAVLGDDYFFNSVKVTLIYIVVTVLGRYVLGFITALLLNTKFLGRGLEGADHHPMGHSGSRSMPGLDSDVRPGLWNH